MIKASLLTLGNSTLFDFGISERAFSFFIKQDTPADFLEISISLELGDASEYVLFPACCYSGNRFDVLPKEYPPMFSPEEASVDMPVTITDVPRLNKDGSGMIEVTAGDVSVPCVAVYVPDQKRAVLFFTVQQACGKNVGLAYEKGRIRVTIPHFRENAYRWPHVRPNQNTGKVFRKGESFELPYSLHDVPCDSMEEFYRLFFEQRKCMGMDDSLPEVLTYSRQFEIHRDRINYMSWSSQGGYYATDVLAGSSLPWQPGWVGGAMNSYALMKLGGDLEWKRASSTIDFLFSTQTESGFFRECADASGKPGDFPFKSPAGTERWCLVRKSADALYFVFKHFDLYRERGLRIPEAWIESTARLANAFAKLWNKYGQFGQFVDWATGDIVVGGSTSGAIASAGLAKAWQWLGSYEYLEVAKSAALLHYERDALKGYTTGGPEEMLQCPDSESCFGLLESMVCLYEVTRDPQWLEKAKHLAHMCSSWVVPYNYRFPEESEFGRLGMKTVGSVFANAQNKHSAPGICTLSGDSLAKLYKWTGDKRYFELFKEITTTIGQYISTEERPIYSWDVPKDASLLDDDSVRAQREKLPQGFICERVNMSDWESERCIGGVFNGNCWCETSNLLALAEAIPYIKAFSERAD
ncbi:MAG: hypothetical protein LBT59_03695 [Clostridiales bacterium]|jgi:hypothetical protein|nr:hypothetical protein [Clostridiales bacterium]